MSGGPIDRTGCLVFALLCLWVLGMGIVMVTADTSPGRALGVLTVSGVAFGAFLLARPHPPDRPG